MKKIYFISLLLLAIFISSCQYKKYEELYPLSQSNCDTIGTYTKVSQTFTVYCVSCHNEDLPNSGFRLDTYEEAYNVAQSGRLIGAIEHKAGFAEMPAEGKLDSCTIKRIVYWVNSGAPNN